MYGSCADGPQDTFQAADMVQLLGELGKARSCATILPAPQTSGFCTASTLLLIANEDHPSTKILRMEHDRGRAASCAVPSASRAVVSCMFDKSAWQ